MLWNIIPESNNCFLCESIVKCDLFLWSKLNFPVTWSSEIIIICWFADQETFLIIINVENSCAASCFCGIFYLMNRKELSLQAICHTFSSLNVSRVGLFLNSFLSTFTDWKRVAYVWLKPHFLMRIYYCCSLFSLCVFSKRVAASLPKSTSEL